MTTQEELANLTTQTTTLLDVVSQVAATVDARIAAAVLASVNASQIPLIDIAVALITTQTMLITQTGPTP